MGGPDSSDDYEPSSDCEATTDDSYGGTDYESCTKPLFPFGILAFSLLFGIAMSLELVDTTFVGFGYSPWFSIWGAILSAKCGECTSDDEWTSARLQN